MSLRDIAANARTTSSINLHQDRLDLFARSPNIHVKSPSLMIAMKTPDVNRTARRYSFVVVFQGLSTSRLTKRDRVSDQYQK